MAAKPETTFYESVHRHLPPVTALWREKMANPYRGGGADHWYSGRRDLWIEWKFIKLPVRDRTFIDLVGGKAPPLSHLQQSWLRDRHLEGRNVWVGVGSALGGVIFDHPDEWTSPFTAGAFRAAVLSRPQLAERIRSFVKDR